MYGSLNSIILHWYFTHTNFSLFVFQFFLL